MRLQPINDGIIFQFVSEQAGGRFIDSTKSGIVLTNQNLNSQNNVPRWGHVLAVGADVPDDIKVGEYILIEPLRWTMGYKFNIGNGDERFWNTNTASVLATSPVPYPDC